MRLVSSVSRLFQKKLQMWTYAQYNPNKGQGDLIKSNSPTSAHQLAPAPLRHAKDLTVMRQATQLIPWPPPPTSAPNYDGWGSVLLLYYHLCPPNRIQLGLQLNLVLTPKTMGAQQGDVQTRHLNIFSCGDVMLIHL